MKMAFFYRRDVAVPVQSRICFIKFFDRDAVGVAQHLTNTVFIDRALIVVPFTGGEMVDEPTAMDIMNSSGAMPGFNQEIQWPMHVKNQVSGGVFNLCIINCYKVLI